LLTAEAAIDLLHCARHPATRDHIFYDVIAREMDSRLFAIFPPSHVSLFTFHL